MKSFAFFYIECDLVSFNPSFQTTEIFLTKSDVSKELTVPPDFLTPDNVISIIYMPCKSLIKNARQDSTLRQML